MNMNKVSIIIPTAGEIFLQKTIDGIFESATGDVEVIVYLDGYWPDPPILDHPFVHIIHTDRVGMFEAINSAVRISTGTYIMKLDGHCLLDKGFDDKLKEDFEDNWLSVPRRYDLIADSWTRGNKITDYEYIAPPRKKSPNDPEHWERGFNGKHWSLPDRENILIDDLMSFQGSCWFMSKAYYEEIGGLDLGNFWLEAQHLGNKVWLSGGRVISNKKTWYAHLHKGKEMGRGYSISRSSCHIKKDIIDFWMNNRWKNQTRPMKWLIEKFNPPGWENWDWSKPWSE